MSGRGAVVITLFLIVLLGAAGWAQGGEKAPATPPAPAFGVGDAEARGKLDEARKAETAGKKAEALRLYRSWLAEHPRSPAVAAVLGASLRLETNPKEAARLLLETLAADPPGRAEILRQAGGILEVTGHVEEAAALYRSAAGDPELRLRLAGLLVGQGEWGEVLQVLEPLRGRAGGVLPGGGGSSGGAALEGRVEFLRGRALQLLGKPAEAEAAWRAALPGSPAAALELFRLLETGGRRQEAGEMLALLESRFPGSPEAALGRAAREAGKAAGPVSPAVTPVDLLGGMSPPVAGGPAATGAAKPTAVSSTPAARSSAPASAAPAKPVLIQTGSFSVEENARYMIRDLERLGYKARILDRDLDGKKFYRVVIDPTGVEPSGGMEGAQKLLLQLKNAGFEGFLLFPD